MASSYRRVPQNETTDTSESLEANVTRSRGERLQDKMIACKWSCAVVKTQAYKIIFINGCLSHIALSFDINN